MVKKEYFIYWWTAKNITGNIILTFDFKKKSLGDLMRLIIKEINEDHSSLGITNITIKFITELK